MPRLASLSIVLCLLAAPALAEPPAAISTSGQDRAERAFQEFARGWMKKVHGLEARERAKPSVTQGPGAPVVTYRGYGDDYRTELRPTGHAVAPYVGLLHYEEHLYSCASMAAENCRVASRVPVTEIFRYQGGRWSY
jgi:hypothetical protein